MRAIARASQKQPSGLFSLAADVGLEGQVIGAVGDEGQVGEMARDARVLGQERPQPDGPGGGHEAHQLLTGQCHGELAGERCLPVVAVGEDEDLAVVAHLEEFLDTAVVESGLDPDLSQEISVKAGIGQEHAGRRGVLGSEIHDDRAGAIVIAGIEPGLADGQVGEFGHGPILAWVGH